MKKLNSKEIRQSWIDFFKSKDHLEIESKSLIPINDPSLLWINSGVATLKDYFSGKKIPPKNRLVNSQKAIRTNDIENVGLTARHHTFFEMLGNFSARRTQRFSLFHFPPKGRKKSSTKVNWCSVFLYIVTASKCKVFYVFPLKSLHFIFDKSSQNPCQIWNFCLFSKPYINFQ
ncbi:Alanyl-tRNA synthetase [Mycoplasmopsis meleagridis]|nr:Alanyl-tRNA synthetase [Mycoplasmopsis meleagridis]